MSEHKYVNTEIEPVIKTAIDIIKRAVKVNNNSENLHGIRITEKYLYATDNFVLMRAPLERDTFYPELEIDKSYKVYNFDTKNKLLSLSDSIDCTYPNCEAIINVEQNIMPANRVCLDSSLLYMITKHFGSICTIEWTQNQRPYRIKIKDYPDIVLILMPCVLEDK